MSTRRRKQEPPVVLIDGPVDMLTPTANGTVASTSTREPHSSSDAATTITNAARKTADVLKFPFCVALSLVISAASLSFMANFLDRELAAVSRSLNDDWAVTSVVALRAVELAIGWYGKYDDIDVLAMTVLSHLPYFYLLTTFYNISVFTAAASLLIDTLAISTPFYILRPRNPSHVPTAPRSIVPARPIINDLTVRVLTSLLAASIYSVIVYASFYTWLPVYLVVHFDGLRDVSAAHDAALPMLVLSFIPIGYAAREFFFSPTVAGAAGTRDHLGDARAKAFNPATATLGETFWHNVWGYSRRDRVLMQRTATLVLLYALNTGLRTYASIEGSEPWGAAGWAAVWAAAAVVTAAMFRWVGRV